MGQENERYNVAFRNTAATGGWCGVITWTAFPSKEAFDEWYTDNLKLTREVVEEGVSQERCLELARSTPLICRITACIEDSLDGDGKINMDRFRMKMQTILLAEMIS